MVQELIARWRKAKNEILRRQSDIKDCFERLSRFNKGIEQHVSFIERKEQEFHSINQTTAETSESLERKIEAMQDVQKDLNDHRTNFSSVIFSQTYFHFNARLTRRRPIKPNLANFCV